MTTTRGRGASRARAHAVPSPTTPAPTTTTSARASGTGERPQPRRRLAGRGHRLLARDRGEAHARGGGETGEASEVRADHDERLGVAARRRPVHAEDDRVPVGG